jgi:NTP pyrophosphatase (non-canonical NTP hydrolase)
MGNTMRMLLGLVERKNAIDQSGLWSSDSETYLAEFTKELAEVEEALSTGSVAHLEDELGDVLWDYLNLLQCLSAEKNISISSVFERALQKYEERISGLENGILWKETKEKQKKRLHEESLLERDST